MAQLLWLKIQISFFILRFFVAIFNPPLSIKLFQMKKYFTAALFIISQGAFAQQQPNVKLKILYLGNSYTYSNNLPDLVYQLGLRTADTLIYDNNTPGGYTLQMHFNNATSISKINADTWDYVVLQAQSQEPSLAPSTVNQNTLPYSLLLDSVIKNNNNCTRTVFFETWGRKYGDAQNCGSYQPVCTFSGMQQRLKESYKIFADTCKGIMSPVGEAYKLSQSIDSTINLYVTDNSHPSLEGSYLAACVFYKIFTHKNPVGNLFHSTLNATTATYLQNVANTTVSDSLNTWNLGIYEPWAEFTWQETAPLTMQCYNATSGNYTHHWDFGDSQQSSLQNPLHVYAQAAYYPMFHVVYDGCTRDSFYTVNNITGQTSINGNFQTVSDEFIISNPALGQLSISSNLLISSLMIYNSLGQLVFIQTRESFYHETNGLVAGVYYVSLTTTDAKQYSMKAVVK